LLATKQRCLPVGSDWMYSMALQSGDAVVGDQRSWSRPNQTSSDVVGLDQETALRVVLAQEPLLTGFLRAIVGSRQLAEDLFQDLVVLVMRKHAQIPNVDAVPGWTRRAARFLALKTLKKRAREKPTMDEALVDLLERTFVEEAGVDEVVGTRFHVAVVDGTSRVTVDHGTVRVRPRAGGEAVLVNAGSASLELLVASQRLVRARLCRR
jgi:DNA-directed RNA polymerase specialized sigma24 family protein